MHLDLSFSLYLYRGIGRLPCSLVERSTETESVSVTSVRGCVICYPTDRLCRDYDCLSVSSAAGYSHDQCLLVHKRAQPPDTVAKHIL